VVRGQSFQEGPGAELLVMGTGRGNISEVETFSAFGCSMKAANLFTFQKFANAKNDIQFVLFLQKK